MWCVSYITCVVVLPRRHRPRRRSSVPPSRAQRGPLREHPCGHRVRPAGAEVPGPARRAALGGVPRAHDQPPVAGARPAAACALRRRFPHQAPRAEAVHVRPARVPDRASGPDAGPWLCADSRPQRAVWHRCGADGAQTPPAVLGAAHAAQCILPVFVVCLGRAAPRGAAAGAARRLGTPSRAIPRRFWPG